ncbi:MAG: hypothetical protein ACRC0L_10150 [Angustibacter sp.]
MVAVELAEDRPFFSQWPGAGRQRSLGRARSLATALGVTWPLPVPVLTVVGSKGKGTAVAHASSVLAAAGLRVGTVTSPPFRRNTERIRVDGKALSLADFCALSDRVAHALKSLPPSVDEYLAPTGVFTVAGVSELLARGVEVLVLEEGLGGRSDEVSLFPADVVVVTPIFEEHLGVIGDSLAEIAADLLGVCCAQTTLVVTTSQGREVTAQFPDARTTPRRVISRAPDVYRKCAPGLSALNAATGAAAAEYLAAQLSRGISPANLSQANFPSWLSAAGERVTLPGRLSVHPPGRGRAGPWILDAAISPPGIRAAAEYLSAEDLAPDVVLACFPDSKDARACFSAARRLFGDITPVTCGQHLSFRQSGGNPLPAARAVADALRHPGPVLALGTMSFIAEVTELLDIPTDSWWH